MLKDIQARKLIDQWRPVPTVSQSSEQTTAVATASQQTRSVTRMVVHFKQLTGINIKEKLESAVTMKLERIIKWMNEQPNKQIKKIREELIEAKLCSDNGQAEVKAIICAILAHLHDKEEFLYVCVKPTTAKAAVEKNLPQTPCLIGFGESKLSATRYMLSVDGVVVNDHIATFTSGLAVLFASYYNLNILYPVEAATTLEFIQRCFVGINPDRGSRIEIKKSGKKHSQAHPKVLSLINAIVDAEWRS
ncbi:hypothetical protein Pcinc_016262 [Petrolisthes cinctipes]|uniref:Uncharacterized protein n=1 Tax=Petrolisthes cinctipes TaxID=88211 RepID=A0AAE1FRG4_PETCI|nr:hypothetical protein Pcinc_016262 [Petrolisthes cinctipes]